MNPVLIISAFIIAGLLWLLCSFLYQPIGKIFKKLADDAQKAITEETEFNKDEKS